MNDLTPRNVGMDLVRATEAAAIHAARWMGLGRLDDADREATLAMFHGLNTCQFSGCIVIGEEGKVGMSSPLESGCTVGRHDGPQMDLVVDPIDGRSLLAQGRSGALAVAAVTPRNTMWSPSPAIYMEKIVVNQAVSSALVHECLDAPVAWTLALVARVKGKPVRDMTVFILDRPRHADMIEEIRSAGARVMLRSDGDISGALMAASPDGHIDLLVGIGGVPEGLIAACAVKALGGAMLARLAPQDAREAQEVSQAGLDTRKILDCDDLVKDKDIFFAATGITDGPLLRGVRYHGDMADTQSLVLRGETGTRRMINAEHRLADFEA